jgi:hypothetical protein
MAGLPEGVINGPRGLLSAIELKAARRGYDRAQLLQRAGITADQLDQLDAILTSADAEVWRRLANAVGSVAMTYENPSPITEGVGGVVDGSTHEGQLQTAFGGLS